MQPQRNNDFSRLSNAVHKLINNDIPHLTKRLDSLDQRLVKIDTHLSWIIKIMMVIVTSGAALVVAIIAGYVP